MNAREGYFVIADIGGYTAFLSGTELEHAQGIIEDLCGAIHTALVPALHFVKLEGDALFCYAEDARFADGERLLEVIEACHFAFSRRIVQMQRTTTCQCAACASIGTLDLKFVAHHGEFVTQRMAGVEDLAGPDVILVHRLLKNGVTEATGWRGYALLTAACAQRTVLTRGWQEHTEDVEPFGAVACKVRDLAPSTAAREAAHRVYVEPREAHLWVTGRLPAPPAIVWQYTLEPEKRLRWQKSIQNLEYDRGAEDRMGPGTVGHCDHGSWASDTRVIDWQPFDYYSLERRPTKGGFQAAPLMTETLEFIAVEGGGTEIHYRARAHTRGGRLKLRLAKGQVRRAFRQEFRELERVLGEDGLVSGSPEEGQ